MGLLEMQEHVQVFPDLKAVMECCYFGKWMTRESVQWIKEEPPDEQASIDAQKITPNELRRLLSGEEGGESWVNILDGCCRYTL